jgi:predicted ATP-dependent serine protease
MGKGTLRLLDPVPSDAGGAAPSDSQEAGETRSEEVSEALREPWRCRKCSTRLPRWLRECPMCTAMNSMMYRPENAPEPDPQSLRPDIAVSPGRVAPEVHERVSTGFPAIDTMLGGGWVRGKVYLIGGKAGTGKTTLVLQTMECAEESSVLSTGEQTRDDVVLIAQRVGATRDGLRVADLGEIGAALALFDRHRARIEFLVSIHRFRARGVDARVGSPRMCEEVLARCLVWARARRAVLIVLSHSTKAGDFSGQSNTQHDVDALLRIVRLKSGARRLEVLKSRVCSEGGHVRLRLDPRGAFEEAPLVKGKPRAQARTHAAPSARRRRTVADPARHDVHRTAGDAPAPRRRRRT